MKILLSMLMLVMLVVVVAPASIGAQEVDGGLRFMSSPEEVMSVYTQLSGPNGKDVYATLSNSMRQDLWSLHLSRALLELNNLSIEQRAVILQGLGLLTRGVLSAEPKDLDWELRFGESLGYLEDQARDLLPRDVRVAVFGRLGASVSMAGEAPQACGEAVSSDKKIPRCTCSSESDFCDFVTNPDSECRGFPDGPRCLPTEGCGLFWQYTCNGHCL